MKGLNQVNFYGMGNSKSKTLIVTFMPDTPLFMISNENDDHMFAPVPRDIENILPVTYIPDAAPAPKLFEKMDWATMFVFTARFANFVEVSPRGAVHNDLQFDPEDPLFGRVSGHTFRYHYYQVFRQDNRRVIRLIFLQQGDASASEIHSIYIDLHVALPEPDDSDHIPFVVQAVRFNRGGQLIDGFQTLPNIAAHIQFKEQKKTKRKDDGDQSQKEPEPPGKKDPPEGSGKKRKTGSSNRSWGFNSGWGGGGNVCSMVQFFIAAVLLSIPSDQKVLFYPDKA
ncbi:hypothetical protein [Endozoicomonas euniceicola]|uniref:Uncharacterized protein n=1 Tax=Endozoicomonas euniceicola TaxID=1234143 RepID=A0ABY6GY74_9GAMM|nr:hypothetical protein [Endozoicomonas euniceicola]UYM17748.1 hypothetical protein NX720_07515 [Endozoicomonas euniceicola]